LNALEPLMERARHIIVADEDPKVATFIIETLRFATVARPCGIYLANIGRSSPALEAKLPTDVPILREPFTADELRASVNSTFNKQCNGGSAHRG
jgi:hypothetical protein